MAKGGRPPKRLFLTRVSLVRVVSVVVDALAAAELHCAALLGHRRGLLCCCRYENVENAKREMRKKQELDERFKTGKDGAASSDEDSDVEDEDKIRDVEEAGAPLQPHVTRWRLAEAKRRIALCGRLRSTNPATAGRHASSGC